MLAILASYALSLSIDQVPCDSSNHGGHRSTSSIKYIVVHYTANNGDTARGNGKYFQGKNRQASAHYFVDESNIVQSVQDDKVAWHCGTSGKYHHDSARNSNSIGVEICSEKDSRGNYYFNDATVNTAVQLVKYLMNKYGIKYLTS